MMSSQDLDRKLTHIVQAISADDNAITFPETYVEELKQLIKESKMTNQPTDPTTGRVIPTREAVAKELEVKLADYKVHHKDLTCFHDAVGGVHIVQLLTTYVMQQKNDDYYRGVNLGISIGRKEMVAAMETVIPEPRKLSDITGTKGEIIVNKSKALGFNEAVNESHKRLKAMVGVLEQGGLDESSEVAK